MSHKNAFAYDNDVIAYQDPSLNALPRRGDDRRKPEQHDAPWAPTETTATVGRSAPGKAFDELQCRGFQFEVGQTYEHDGRSRLAKAASMFARTARRVEILPADSRYAVVELGGRR